MTDQEIIEATARAIWASRHPYVPHFDSLFEGGPSRIERKQTIADAHAAFAVCAKAIRERDAQIAETLKTLDAWLPNGDGTGDFHHTTIHGEKIATAIRAQEPSK